MNIAEHRLEVGAKYPYDEPDAPVATDWAIAAARGVLADLSDRRGIKWELQQIDKDVRREIVHSLADIIRLAHQQDKRQ